MILIYVNSATLHFSWSNFKWVLFINLYNNMYAICNSCMWALPNWSGLFLPPLSPLYTSNKLFTNECYTCVICQPGWWKKNPTIIPHAKLRRGVLTMTWYKYVQCLPFGVLFHEIWNSDRPRGVLTYLAERGCAALMGRFFTRNP